MWFKYGLKAQKLLAQGSALGIMAMSNAPCKGKSFINFSVSFRASAPSGRAASMSFCPLPMLSAGDLWLRACRVISTVQVILFFRLVMKLFCLLRINLYSVTRNVRSKSRNGGSELRNVRSVSRNGTFCSLNKTFI